MDALSEITDLYIAELRAGQGRVLPSEAAENVGRKIGFSAHEVITIASSVMLSRRDAH